MKRIYISLAFFILSIATGIFEMFYVTNRIDELNEEIVSADSLVKSENYDGAKDVLAAAESKWQKNLIIFDILLIHDYVDEISVNLSAMRSYVATQSNDNYLAESAGIKKQLTSVKDSELVKIENILLNNCVFLLLVLITSISQKITNTKAFTITTLAPVGVSIV